jgi:hypothetical protein
MAVRATRAVARREISRERRSGGQTVMERTGG